MNDYKDNTLLKIQNEIKENLRREKELKSGYEKMNGHNHTDTLVIESKANSNSSTLRRFIPNTNTKGVMQKFFKSRGKFNSLKPTDSKSSFVNDAAFRPAILVVEKGKPLRNGYIPTKEKIVKELLEFQSRETELRNERIKSQSDLMAALDVENSDFKWGNGVGDILKPGKSLSSLHLLDEDENQNNNYSSSSSLKPSRSLAALCDLSDEEVDIPGTHSLIMQFEKMRTEDN